MNGMIGSDPDALDRLAADFDRAAGTLEMTVIRIGAQVAANPWAGPRATRFRNDWNNRYGPQLKRTAAALRAAAKQLRLQAQEQRQASSAGGMGAGGANAMSGSGRGGPSSNRDRIEAAIGAAMAALGIGRDLAEEIVNALDKRLAATGLTAATRDLILDPRLVKALRLGGHALAVVGAVQGLVDIIQGSQAGDMAKGLRGVLGVTGAATSVVFAPIGVAIGAASAYGDVMLATDTEEIAAVEARTMQARFGSDATPPYTDVQTAWLAQRYEGFGGFLNSVGDQVDHGMRWMNDPIRDAGQDFRKWRHAQGWW